MVTDILKAILVGICAVLPLGPIAIFVLSKCLNKGRRAGMVTALGSVTVDTVFSIVAIFALAFFQDFMDNNHEWVSFGGGVILLIVGAVMAFRNPYRKSDRAVEREKDKEKASPADYFQALGMGLSNIGAILVIFGLFAFFGICDDSPRDWSVAPIIIAFACGETLYWLLFTFVASRFHGKLSVDKMVWGNRFMGIVLAIIGLAFLADGIFRLASGNGLF